MPEFCEAKSHRFAPPSGNEKARQGFSQIQGPLGEESYIAPVASLATALSEQGRNI